MKAEIIATVQGKLLLYRDEAIWLHDVISKQKHSGSDSHQRNADNLLKELDKIIQYELVLDTID